MELWIRSQSKERLVKCENIDIYDRNQINFIENIGEDLDLKFEIMIIANNNIKLGTYKTKERALEVLDEIEGILMFARLEKVTGNNFINVENNVAIYEMPEE